MAGASPYDLMQTYTRQGRKITKLARVLDLMVRGVHIITTSHEEQPYGLAAAWALRVSGSPYLLMAAVYQRSHTHPFIRMSGAFAVNLLAADQAEIARHFGRQTGRDVDKFKREDIYWERRTTGSPILIDALAYFDCRVVDGYDPPGGDHTLYIGEVIDADQLREAEPLIFRRSDYPYRVTQIQE